MTEPEVALLEEKYGKLIKYAANYIHGDKSQSQEDYEQEIKLLLLENIEKYIKRLNLKSFQELVDQYDHYIKQWIWTYRYGKGAENTRHKASRNPISLDVLNSLNEHDAVLSDYEFTQASNYQTSSNFGLIHKEVSRKSREESTVIDDLFIKELESKEKTTRNKILLALIKDPEVYKLSGKLNVVALAKAIKTPINKVKSVLWELEKEFKHAKRSF